jgi:hypothetical protein
LRSFRTNASLAGIWLSCRTSPGPSSAPVPAVAPPPKSRQQTSSNRGSMVSTVAHQPRMLIGLFFLLDITMRSRGHTNNWPEAACADRLGRLDLFQEQGDLRTPPFAAPRRPPQRVRHVRRRRSAQCHRPRPAPGAARPRTLMPDSRRWRTTPRPTKPVPPNTATLLIPRSVKWSSGTLSI